MHRLIVLIGFLSLLFCTLIARFYHIQIVEGEKWTEVALSQHEGSVSIPFKRGSFYSNTSIKQGHPTAPQPFVMDIPKFHLFIDPESIPGVSKERMEEELFRKLKCSSKEKEKMHVAFYKKSRSRKIASWLDLSQRETIEKWWKEFSKKEKIVSNALFFRFDYQRSYPFGSMLGAVLHTVQEEKDPSGQAIPTGGLEMVFHSYLSGKKGKKRILRSPTRELQGGETMIASQDGADVYLTINHYLQAIAETELAKGVKEAGAKGGLAVMMDPWTGEILALAETPSFHPAEYAKYFNDPKLQVATKIHSVTDAFEPGSIFKPLVLAVCLKGNEELLKQGKRPLFSPEEKIPTSNGWFPGRRTPLKDGRKHNFLNMNLAVQKSSNVYMGRVVERCISEFGNTWFRNSLIETFGLGQKTGIELPKESPGLLPTPGKVHPNGKLEWSLPTPYSLALGHNVLVNAIQVVRAYAVLANGGILVEPHIVRKIEGADGSVLFDRTRSRGGKRVVSEKIVKRLVHALKFTTKLGGTALRGDIPGYTEAGKSGTSEKIVNGVYSKEKHVSSFIVFTPLNAPRLVLLVSLDEPEVRFIPTVGKNQMGGVSAAPISREIARKSLEYLGVFPDDPYGYPYGDERRDPKKADLADEVEALKNLYQEWNS